MTDPHEVLDLTFSKAQWDFWTATDRYVDFEGAVRAGTTTPAVLKVIDSCHDQSRVPRDAKHCADAPGIHPPRTGAQVVMHVALGIRGRRLCRPASRSHP